MPFTRSPPRQRSRPGSEPQFSEWARDRCARAGIDIETTYRMMLLEIRITPSERLTADIGQADVTVSPREAEMLSSIADGMRTRQAAAKLGITFETARTYLDRARDKLDAVNTTHAVAIAIRRGLI